MTLKKYQSATGGLNNLGRAHFHLKRPSRDAANPRHRSFCARMSGMPGPMERGGKKTRKKLALDKWNC
jgi:hypothetical protein